MDRTIVHLCKDVCILLFPSANVPSSFEFFFVRHQFYVAPRPLLTLGDPSCLACIVISIPHTSKVLCIRHERVQYDRSDPEIEKPSPKNK